MRSRSTSLLLAVSATLAFSACSSDSPSGPTPPPAPTPTPAPVVESRWDVDVVVRYVKASADEVCDGTIPIIGTVDPGEFQYRIVASFGSQTDSTQSSGYGSVTGNSRTMSPEELWNFGNETMTFSNLRAGQSVELTLFATEWDIASKDGYLNNRSNSLTITPSSLLPNGGTRTDRALGVGNATCGLTLYHDVTARVRQVTTG
jgi:hypothetical protein